MCLVVAGKTKRAVRGYAHVYKEKAYKKAIVTFGEGEITKEDRLLLSKGYAGTDKYQVTK